MLAESEVRSHYLSLALDVRKLIDSLVLFVEKDQRDEALDTDLREFLESLDSVSAPIGIFSPLQGRPVFGHYEQILTLEEVKASLRDTNIAADVAAVLDPKGDPGTQKKNAYEAIRFLSALEGRALNHYAQGVGAQSTK